MKSRLTLLFVAVAFVAATALPASAVSGSYEFRTTNGAKLHQNGNVWLNGDYGPGVFDWGVATWDGVNRWVVEFNVGDMTGLLGAGEMFQVTDARLDLRLKTNSGSPGDAYAGHIIDDGTIDSSDFNSAMDYAIVGTIPGTTPNNTDLHLWNADLFSAISDDMNAGRAWHSYRLYLADESITPAGPVGNAASFYQIPVPDPIQVSGNNASPRLRVWYDIVPIPEPATLCVLALGGLLTVLKRRR